MKKRTLITVVVVFTLLVSFVACSENQTGDTEIIDWGDSALYTDDEIKSAIDTVVIYFEAEFKGCTLTKISYSGDDSSDAFDEWAKQYDADEAIVLLSSFDTDSSGGDGSLEPNSTYNNWQWILVRDRSGIWELATYGYG